MTLKVMAMGRLVDIKTFAENATISQKSSHPINGTVSILEIFAVEWQGFQNC
jgi:hypothetical protein